MSVHTKAFAVCENKCLVPIVDLIYPVGSIYMSVNSASPSDLFGGTWERIQDRFLLASGSTYSAGSIGGEDSHTLTIDEMPMHSHDITGSVSVKQLSNFIPNTKGMDWYLYYGDDSSGETGGSQPHNNMPPYLAVNVWKRTK